MSHYIQLGNLIIKGKKETIFIRAVFSFLRYKYFPDIIYTDNTGKYKPFQIN